jgi:hypothetical protein
VSGPDPLKARVLRWFDGEDHTPPNENRPLYAAYYRTEPRPDPIADLVLPPLTADEAKPGPWPDDYRSSTMHDNAPLDPDAMGAKPSPTPNLDEVDSNTLRFAEQIEFYIRGACSSADGPTLKWIGDEHAHAIAELIAAIPEAHMLRNELNQAKSERDAANARAFVLEEQAAGCKHWIEQSGKHLAIASELRERLKAQTAGHEITKQVFARTLEKMNRRHKAKKARK